MAELALIAGAIGTGIQVLGTLQSGREQKARFQYEQKVQSMQADEAMAASQRDAQARNREGQLLMSQQRAGLAASGADLTEPSIINLMGDTSREIDLARRSELYKGDQQARGYNDAAKVSGINAQNAMRAATLSAGASLFAGVSSMYSRFGQQARQTQTVSTAPLPYG